MKQQLHPGARWLFRVRSYTSLIFIVFVVSIWLSSMFTFFITEGEPDVNWLIGYGVGALIGIVIVVIIAEVYARMAYARWFYEFTPTNLRIERGIIWKQYSNVPYERVQNVDIQRGIIARLCGFSSVNIQTAGYGGGPMRGRGLGAEGYVPAVDTAGAERIRDFVIQKISKNKNGQGL